MKQLDPLLTAADVARVTQLRRGTIYTLSYQRRLPSIKLGKALRFRLSDVERFIQAGARPARAE